VGTERDRHVDVEIVEIERTAQARLVKALTAQGTQYLPIGKRLADHDRDAHGLGLLDSLHRIAQRLFVFTGVRLRERQHEKGLRHHQRVALRVAEGALESVGGLAETPLVDPQSGKQIQCERPLRARR
jgi:hypothetical protein